MSVPLYTPYEMINKLVSFDTTSRHSNLHLINFVSDYLSQYGVKSHIVADDSGTKANLLATIGPNVDGGVMLSGHTDVVPVDGQHWDTNPFATTKANGRIYGRGTADMKSFSGIFLSHLPRFVKARLKRPIHLALSYDEEVGCLGAPDLINTARRLSLRPKLVIIGEPTNMKVINRHKSVLSYRTTITGVESHSAYPDQGVNAIFFAGDVVHFLHGLSQTFSSNPIQEPRFDPPYSTLHIGLINGGTAQNIVPKICSFDWEVRALPGDNISTLVLEPLEKFVLEKVTPRMKAISKSATVQTTALGEVPGLAPQAENSLEHLLCELTGYNSDPESIAFATEGGLFQKQNFPTLICGPGNILQAHKPNEYIELSQIQACEKFFGRLLNHLSS